MIVEKFFSQWKFPKMNLQYIQLLIMEEPMHDEQLPSGYSRCVLLERNALSGIPEKVFCHVIDQDETW